MCALGQPQASNGSGSKRPPSVTTHKTRIKGESFPALYQLFHFDQGRFEENHVHHLNDRSLKGLDIWDEEWRAYIDAAPATAKAFALAQSVEHFYHLNAAPHLVRYRAGPLFFEHYPDGVIWFVRVSQQVMVDI